MCMYTHHMEIKGTRYWDLHIMGSQPGCEKTFWLIYNMLIFLARYAILHIHVWLSPFFLCFSSARTNCRNSENAVSGAVYGKAW